MPDIIMCRSLNCPVRNECYRSVHVTDELKSYNFEYICNEESAFSEYIKNEVKE